MVARDAHYSLNAGTLSANSSLFDTNCYGCASYSNASISGASSALFITLGQCNQYRRTFARRSDQACASLNNA
jgi:hypothetical protein